MSVKMEALYAKLHDRYIKLKKEKEARFDELNRDQEVKFLNFAAAADEMIHYLKNENDRLNGQVGALKSENDRFNGRVNDLTNELASIRYESIGIMSSDKEQLIHCQGLLMEANQKNKELSEEIERLQKIVHKEHAHVTEHEKIGHEQENAHKDASAMLDQHSYGYNGTGPCCQRKINKSGDDATDTGSANCMFQHLVEFVLGMRISLVTQSDELCLLAHHQSSGYSFSLTWTSNPKGEAELVYNVLSLGTLKRVAPEWMRETLKFSTSMCGVFFQRISGVVRS